MRVPSKECLSAVSVRSVHSIVSSATAVPSIVPMAGPDHIPQTSLDHHIHLTSLLMAGPWDIRTAHPLWLLKKGGSRWNLGYRKPCETSCLLPFRSRSVYRVGCASHVMSRCLERVCVLCWIGKALLCLLDQQRCLGILAGAAMIFRLMWQWGNVLGKKRCQFLWSKITWIRVPS